MIRLRITLTSGGRVRRVNVDPADVESVLVRLEDQTDGRLLPGREKVVRRHQRSALVKARKHDAAGSLPIPPAVSTENTVDSAGCEPQGRSPW